MHGNQLPTDTGAPIQMPHGTMSEVVSEVLQSIRMNTGISVSRSYVYSKLAKEFPHVSCPKHKMMLECADCAKFRNAILFAKTNEQVRMCRDRLAGHRVQQYEQENNTGVKLLRLMIIQTNNGQYYMMVWIELKHAFLVGVNR
jgi:hypothetical protein